MQSDRQDKTAMGWDHVENVEKHGSQKGKPVCNALSDSLGPLSVVEKLTGFLSGLVQRKCLVNKALFSRGLVL